MAAAQPLPSRTPRAEWPAAPAKEWLLAVLLASCAIVGAIAINRSALGGVPHVADEVSYLFQAKVFAHGQLALEPESKALFGVENIILDATRWVSIYPPGWPAILALGCLVGAPMLVAPLLLGLAVVGLWALGRSLFGSTTGLLAAALLASSPFALTMGASVMSHTPTLALTLWCFWCLTMAPGRNRWWWCAAGFLGAYAGAIRPLTALLFLPIPVLWALAREGRLAASRRTSLAPLAGAVVALGAGTLIPAIATMSFNLMMFGSPLEFGYHFYDPSLRMTGRRGHYFPVLGILAHHLPWYLGQLSATVASLPGSVYLWLLPLLRTRPGRNLDVLLASTATVLIVGQSCYFWADHVYGGPRLVFEALGPLCLLLARSLHWLATATLALLQRWPGGRTSLVAQRLGFTFAAGMVLWTLSYRLPPELNRVRSWYHGNSRQLIDALSDHALGAERVGDSALVLVAASPSALGLLLVTADLPPRSSGRVFARDLPAQRTAIAAAFPREETWLLELELEPIPGPNVYPDTNKLQRLALTRLR